MSETTPEPFMLEVAIEPGNRTESDALETAIERLCSNNARCASSRDSESGLIVISSSSEHDLDTLLDILRNVVGYDVNVGAQQVAYRETLSKPVTIQYTHKKQTGGSGEFAEVRIEFEPLPPGSGFVFENQVIGGAIPKEFIPSVEKGLKAQKEKGLLAGFPVIDFQARLVDGKYHEMDSNARAFDIAARAAFRKLASEDAVKLLEPIMKVEVVTPEDFLDSIVDDLNFRRGKVVGTEKLGRAQIITADAPLAGMLGYANRLRSATQDRARYTMRFDHYGPVSSGHGGDDPNVPAAAALRVA